MELLTSYTKRSKARETQVGTRGPPRRRHRPLHGERPVRTHGDRAWARTGQTHTPQRNTKGNRVERGPPASVRARRHSKAGEEVEDGQRRLDSSPGRTPGPRPPGPPQPAPHGLAGPGPTLRPPLPEPRAIVDNFEGEHGTRRNRETPPEPGRGTKSRLLSRQHS